MENELDKEKDLITDSEIIAKITKIIFFFKNKRSRKYIE